VHKIVYFISAFSLAKTVQ